MSINEVIINKSFNDTLRQLILRPRPLAKTLIFTNFFAFSDKSYFALASIISARIAPVVFKINIPNIWILGWIYS